MDVARPINKRKRTITRSLYGIGGVTVLAAITVGLSHLKPAAPSVSRATVLVDTVKRGPMVRQVRGLGTLVPEEVRWIPAATEGRVERILVRPGTAVEAGTVLIELSNPELEQAAQDAALQVKAAEAEYAGLKVRLESQLLDQQAAAATVQSDFHQARIQAERNEELGKHGLVSEIDRQLSRVKAEELSTRHAIEEKRLSIGAESVQAQLAAQQARTDQLRALERLRHEQVRSLKVRAG